MRTRLLMILSAGFMALAGVAAAFLPSEILTIDPIYFLLS